jgi:solute carrier family 6 GABA transporter-like protein 1
MPGANFWAILLFFTLIVLGFSSAFVMLDVVATLIVDSDFSFSRPVVVTSLTILSFLMTLPYCTQFGYHLLDGIDRWINNVVLIFVVWAESVSSTSIYRYRDVIAETGITSFAVYNASYLGAQVLGIALAHGLGNPGAGAGAGFGLYVVGSIVATILATTTPEAQAAAPRFWKKHSLLSRFWYLAFYSVRRCHTLWAPS